MIENHRIGVFNIFAGNGNVDLRARGTAHRHGRQQSRHRQADGLGYSCGTDKTDKA